MFIFNLFGKSSGPAEQQKCDKINFKIDLNQNVPKLHDWSQQQYVEEQQLTPNHPLYYQIFPKQEQKFVEYLTTENDTLTGLAMKLDISEKAIRDINSSTGHIYPGMRIKLPEGTDLGKLDRSPSPKKVKISQIVGEPKTHQTVNAKYSVYYSVGYNGKIRGTLTINSNYLIFNPSLDDTANIQKFNGAVERLLAYNAIVQTVDIQDVSFIDIPAMGEGEDPVTKQIMVQLMLYRVGNTKIQKKYKDRLKQLKLDHKAIASMTFIIDQQEKEAHGVGMSLMQQVQTIIKQVEERGEGGDTQEKNRLTNIPFFDIIHQNIMPKVEEEEQKQVTGKIINPSAILGSFTQPSDVLSPQQFGAIVKKLPVLYQLCNWIKVYGSTRDGSSFSTFLNRCTGVQPAVLLVKEHKGYKFGAFLVDFIKLGKSGRGEMFIFSFKEEDEPEVYRWTGSNQSFVYVQKQKGVGIGMGFKYGIFIKNDFDRGSTSYTNTFGNKEGLSKKEDFYIDEVQIWGLDMSY